MNELGFDLIVRGGTCVTPGGRRAVRRRRSARAASWRSATSARPAAQHVLDAAGLHVLPGVIDPQVHFREPGADPQGGSGDRDGGGGARRRDLRARDAEHQSADHDRGRARRQDRPRSRAGPGATSGSSSARRPTTSATSTSSRACPGAPGSRSSWAARPATCWSPTTSSSPATLSGGFRRVAIHAEDEPRLRERRELRDRGRGPPGVARRRDRAARDLAGPGPGPALRPPGPHPPPVDRGRAAA